MKHMRMYLSYLAAAVLAAGFLAMSGCEEDPSTDVDDIGSNTTSSTLGDRSNPSTRDSDLTVTPSTAEVKKVGDQIVFQVKGSSGTFSWSVEKSNLGTVAPVSGNTRQATYTATSVAANKVIVRDSNGHTATANITGGNTASLSITPSACTWSTNDAIAVGQTMTFVALGGAPPYKDWTLTASGPDIAAVTSSGTQNDKAVVTFTVAIPVSSDTWSFGLVVKDSADNSAQATIERK